MSSDWEYQVRHRAYELWNAAGRPDGKHQEFWEVAERELRAQQAGASNGSGAGTPDHRSADGEKKGR